ncbi:hypothetical protein VTO42DRAFT_2966 [Malbranchea cinnamomea]
MHLQPSLRFQPAEEDIAGRHRVSVAQKISASSSIGRHITGRIIFGQLVTRCHCQSLPDSACWTVTSRRRMEISSRMGGNLMCLSPNAIILCRYAARTHDAQSGKGEGKLPDGACSVPAVGTVRTIHTVVLRTMDHGFLVAALHRPLREENAAHKAAKSSDGNRKVAGHPLFCERVHSGHDTALIHVLWAGDEEDVLMRWLVAILTVG